MVFAGEGFEQEPSLVQAKGLLLDFFRGRQVTTLGLKVCLLSFPFVSFFSESEPLYPHSTRSQHVTGQVLPEVEIRERGEGLNTYEVANDEVPFEALLPECSKQAR